MEAGEPLSESQAPGGDLAKAVFEFMGELEACPALSGGVIGPPYVHRLGPTWWPEFTVQDTLPRWEPPRPAFGTCGTPVEPYPVKAKTQEIPEAFRRRQA